MSPALVDSWNSTSPTIPQKPAPLPPRNPSIAGPSPPKAPAAIPSSSSATARHRPAAAEGNLENVLSMLFPSPKADRDQPAAPSPGLSKPRFVKVRRHFASPRVRPGPAPVPPADSDIAIDTGANPLRRRPPPSGDVSGAGRSNPTIPSSFGDARTDGSSFMFPGGVSSDRGESATASANATKGGFVPTEAQNAAFVFTADHSDSGSGDAAYLANSSSTVGGNAGFGGSTPLTRRFMPGSAVTIDGGTTQLKNGKHEGAPLSSGVFLFESSSMKGMVSDQSSVDGTDKCATSKLPEEIQKLNINSSLNAGKTGKIAGEKCSFAASNSGTFVFDVNKNISNSSGESNCTQRVFGFGNSWNECTVPDGGSTYFSSKGSVEKLPEEIQKLNIKDSTIRKCSVEVEDAGHKSTSSRSCSSSTETIHETGIFGFDKIEKHPNFDESKSFKLPDQMKKLHIDVPGSVEGMGRMTVPDSSANSSEVDPTKVFVFGSNYDISSSSHHSMDKLPEELKMSNSVMPTRNLTECKEEIVTPSAGVFVFGSSSKNNAIPLQDAVGSFDENATGKLPEKMQNMKISSLGDDVGTGKSGGGKDGLSYGTFVFGSRRSVFASDKCSVRNGFGTSASGSNENGSDLFRESNSSANCFVFGSGFMQETDTADSSDHVNFEKLPDEMQRLDIRGSQNFSHIKKAEVGDSNRNNGAFIFGNNTNSSTLHTETSSISDAFVFGSSSSSTVFNECTADRFNKDNELQDEMQKLNIMGSKVNDPYEKSKGGNCVPMASDSGVHDESTFTSMSTSQQFLFHATKEDANSGFVGVPPPFAEFFSKPMTETKTSSPLSSIDAISQSSGCDSSFTGHFEESGMPNMKSTSTKLDPSWQSKDNFSQPPNVMFNIKNGAFSHSRSKKRRGKLRVPSSNSEREGKGSTSRERIPQVNPKHDLTGDYSPMDFSPCQMEPSMAENCSREASVTSGNSVDRTSYPSPSDIQNSIPDCLNDTRLARAEEHMDAKNENLRQIHDEVEPCIKTGFAFAATPSAQGFTSSSKQSHRRKFKTKVGRHTYACNSDVPVHSPSTEQLFPDLNISSKLDIGKVPKAPSPPVTLQDNKAETTERPDVRDESVSMAASSIAAQETCEKWRLRGNQAYAKGDLSKAEEYYTCGVNSISSNESSRSCAHALMLCYSNRAATRMSIGRIREALCDCLMSVAIDPGFLRAQLRAANCYLLLGEIEDACNHFKKCLPKGTESCVDRKFVLEASDGLQKAKKAADHMEHAKLLLKKRTTDDATSAVQTISDALSLCPYSDSLMEMKAEALLMLRRYDELIQACDQTLGSAEIKSSLLGASDHVCQGVNFSDMLSLHAKAWRCYLKSRAYFSLGRLEETLSLIQEQEQAEGAAGRCRSKSDALALLSTTARELLRLKIAGNTAFKAGRHSEAVEHYTASLAYNIESRPFAAVCFCNRAAAHQALGQITDAISDCSFAIALDPCYVKAISRRATLHEMIRDYSQASNDLRRLISLQEGNIEDKSSVKRATGNGDDPEIIRSRLAKVEEKARKEIPLDVYMILGVETSSDSAEIKKAYRKAALRHHPDKVCQVLVRSENANEGLWKEVADEVHKYADYLFKTIGEAYAVLSDPSKRLQYDSEEETRSSPKGNSSPSTPRTQPDLNSSHYERGSGSRWQSRDNWRNAATSQRWSGSYRTSSRYF